MSRLLPTPPFLALVLAVVFTTFGTVAFGQRCEWRLVAETGPSPRMNSAAAYDSTRKVVVIHGGQRGSQVSNETWEYDGIEWTLRAMTGPPRTGHAMTFDTTSSVVVLFGGTSGGHETWEWNGMQWALVAESGPPARRQPAMAYDKIRERSVLFGGAEAQYFGDTWEWDGAQWMLVADTGPSPRAASMMAYDVGRGVTVLFGGASGSFVREGDTWEWNGDVWAKVSDTGPAARSTGALTYDTERGLTLLFGGWRGFLGTAFFDTWEWDGRS